MKKSVITALTAAMVITLSSITAFAATTISLWVIYLAASQVIIQLIA